MTFQEKLDRRIVRIQSSGLLDLEAWRLELLDLKNQRFRTVRIQSCQSLEFRRLDLKIQKLQLSEFEMIRLENLEIRNTQNLKLLECGT